MVAEMITSWTENSLISYSPFSAVLYPSGSKTFIQCSVYEGELMDEAG
ncbi:MAG: hypothetical protein RMI43_07020 [Candidatus Caldarchaeum sp.]|nr:hypothetical protein [Candidatus Caldarchaeum sp.]MDW8063905.1 hypothetical protein [Candidatus Caldarchaeum sp.]